MTEKPAPEVDESSASLARIIALSDGVFAIAITLLGLDIVPHIASSVTGAQLTRRLEDVAPELIAYFLSFLVIGRFWDYHRTIFRFIKITDVRIVWGNLLLLLWMTLIPATAELLGSHTGDRIAIVLYAVNLLLATVSTWTLWRYVSSAGFLRREGLHANIDRYIDWLLGLRAAGYVLTMLTAIVAPRLALIVVFLASLLPRTVTHRFAAWRSGTSADSSADSADDGSNDMVRAK